MAFAIIRVRGVKNIRGGIRKALSQLHLTRKNHCIVVDSKDEWLEHALRKTKDYVTWGEVDAQTLALLEKRKHVLIQGKGSAKTKVRLFRLNNPKGGWKSVKNHFPKGDLGYRKEKMGDLIRKMLH